jgi:uncharacterized protein (DUF427 family)
MDQEFPFRVESSGKRVRAMANGRTVADTLSPLLLVEGYAPVWYFPPRDVRADLLERTNHHTECPHCGVAQYWTVKAGDHRAENAAWRYDDPPDARARPIAGRYAFEWEKMDHWFEEDEEVFGHPRDPRHRVDVRATTRRVRATFAGEEIARTHRALLVFETDLPTRYYIPLEDVRLDLLQPSRTTTICPYKGQASYWHACAGGRTAEDAAWAYMDPLPEQPRLRNHLCFYPEKVDLLEVEGGPGRR